MPDIDGTRIKMVTIGNAEHHEDPRVKECTELVIQFGGKIDPLVDGLIAARGADKIGCNAMIGALSAVLGRQAAQFALAAQMDEKKIDEFFSSVAESVKANAQTRVPMIRKSFADYMAKQAKEGTVQ